LSSLPSSFIQSLQGLPGFNEPAFIQAHKFPEQVTSIRTNSAKQTLSNNRQLAIDNTGNPDFVSGHNAVNVELNEHQPNIINQPSQMVPWCSTGYYLPQRPAFTLDPLFHAGAYYVQEASSMFLEQALLQSIDLSQPLKVLDVCAAPGGKSTHLQSLISKDSLLISNEVIKARASVLTENITKWGAANVVVTNNDPSHFQRLPHFFDVVVVDAPCSGSGLFRKDPDAISEWSEEAVQLCSQRQQRILADVLSCLQPGGTLVYATCSYSTAEDEEILTWLHQNFELESIRLQLQPDWNIIETIANEAYGYRFYPDKVMGEGFFIAVFKKQGITEETPFVTAKIKPSAMEKAAAVILQTWLKDEMNFIAEKDDWLAMPAIAATCLPHLKKNLYLRKAGINMGRLIRNELLPHHELALSSNISQNVVVINVNEQQALQYLRRQDVAIETPENGWLLVTYQGYALGWLKAMGNRINNYYPMEWRIRK
jgi:16S rRNA C967 or C1407 C5-methylase (RsmB/RsmF family)/NOL1/NOP2/fmu family ribosome biogenesis protein